MIYSHKGIDNNKSLILLSLQLTEYYFYFPVAQQSKSGPGRLLLEVSKSHSDTQHTR
jgi:hypothetical protein